MKYILKLLSLIFLIIFVIGCSSKKLEHVTFISQNVNDYSKNLVENSSELNQSKYEKDYFKAWNNNYKTKNNIKWAFDTYKVGKSYGENLQLLNKDFFDTMLKNSNYKNYLTINKKAITLQEVNLRAFPTNRPLLMDPSRAGEGFPFDYLQNSSIHANKPILVTHYSEDREWAHIFSSFAFGWIKVRDLAFLEEYQVDKLENNQHVFIIKDGIPIYSLKGLFLFKSKIGMMLTLINEDEKNYTILAVSSNQISKPLFVKAKVSKNIAHKNIIAFNRKNINKIINQLLKSNYGWGGIYGQRDCSSTMRDLFAPFGLWLPRNSYKQSLVGEVISLSGLSNDEKIDIIRRKAIPFKTLFYKRGHIVLYTGVVNNKITIFQNLWGIKTKKDKIEGRYIVGKTIFSTLSLGTKLTYHDKDSNFITKLKSINILF